MELCNHCDIVYDERACPLCIAKTEIETLTKEIDSLKDEIKSMEA